jgi:hypothetical protein
VTINLNGQPKTVATAEGDRLERLSDSLDELQRLLDTLDDENEDLAENLDAVDWFDGPASWFEPGETVFAADKNYVFCPAPHRRQILCIFIRHFCEHPLLPDRSGNTRTSKQIRYDAVFEMYKFCEQRSLREVWDTCGQPGIVPRSTGSGHGQASLILLGDGAQRWPSKISGVI